MSGILELLKRLEKEILNIENTDAIIDTWQKIGFLDGIEDETKKKYVALALNELASDILKGNIKYADYPCENFDIVGFAFIRRVIMDPNYKNINDIDYDLLKKSLGEITVQEALDAACEYKEITNEKFKTSKEELLKTFEPFANKEMSDVLNNFFLMKHYDSAIDIEAELVVFATYWYVLQIMKRNKKEV